MYVTLHGSFVQNQSAGVSPSVFFSFFSPLIIAACMAAVGLFHKRLASLATKPPLVAAATLLALAGSLVMVSTDRGETLRHAASLATHVLLDVLLVSWLKVLSDFDLEIIVKKIPGILSVTGIGTALLLWAPLPLRYALFVALPLAHLAAILHANKTSPSAPIAVEGARAPTIAEVLATTGLFCVASGILLSLTRFTRADELSTPFYFFFLAEIGLTLLAASAITFTQSYLLRKTQANSFSPLPLVSPIVCAGVFAVAFALPDKQATLSSMGLACYNLVFVVAFIVVAKHYACSVIQLFAFGRSVYSVASAASNFLVLTFASSRADDVFAVELFVLVFACQIVAVLGFAVCLIVRNDAKQESAAHDEPREEAKPSVIAQLSGRYKLSERETEVMAQLVKGRSIKRTAEELYVSQGTVNTYLRRIYQKMGIHTRQELLDLFDTEKEQTKGR